MTTDLQFYPTPDAVIEMMIAPLIKTITYQDNPQIYSYKAGLAHQYISRCKLLEPSAGQGHIVDYMVSKWGFQKSDIICVEVDPNNRAVLQQKGYKVVGFDFLEYNEWYPVDLILMNPPFADADSHILKAWSILRGGDMVALCNAETIRNPYSRERQVLVKLIEQHGSVEYIGKVFTDDEIVADVDVAIVRLHKEKEESLFAFDAELDTDGTVYDGDYVSNGELAPRSMVQSLVAQYDKARELTIKAHELETMRQFYTRDILDAKTEEQQDKVLSEKLDELKAAFWNYAFKKTEIGEKTTSKFRDDFYIFKEQNKHIAFNYNNVASVLEMFLLNTSVFMQRCIADTFDAATRYHQKNRVHVEGWKTNLSYMVNRKIIMPNVVDKFLGWKIAYSAHDFVNDLDKACCFLTGKQYDHVLTIEQAFDNHVKRMNEEYEVDYWDKFYSEFFEIRVYKKGTMWLTFRDEKLWRDFNIAAADGKAFIGGGY